MNFQEKLKSETKELHDSSEKHPFHVQLIQGVLPDQKYFVYLHNLFPIFSYIERRMDLKGELIRSPLMHTDIMRYSKDNCVLTGQDLYYFDWIEEIGQKDDKWLSAILYVEWLKDAYGGQMLSKNIKYHSLLKFYEMKNVISGVRHYLDSVATEDQDQFIVEVNNVYKNHNKILDKIMNVHTQ